MDGGGSKTKFIITTINGEYIDSLLTTGCSYPQLGINFVCNFIYQNIEMLLKKNKISCNNISAICLGLPYLGENLRQDEILKDKLKIILNVYTDKLIMVNDVELGFWGAQPDGVGIHIVAGTGAISYARTADGLSYRSNGWHNILSDEGSGFWLGMNAISLYLKQFDNRVKRNHLYYEMSNYIEKKYNITNPLDFINFFDENLFNNRKAIADFQQVLACAALNGDCSANKLYIKAAYELYNSILALKRYFFNETPKITFSGGLFKTENLLLKQLKLLLNQSGLHIDYPCMTPEKGGILLCLKCLGIEKQTNIK